jgi:hypothetical protein
MKFDTIYVFAVISIQCHSATVVKSSSYFQSVTEAQPDLVGGDFCSPDQFTALRAGMAEARTTASTTEQVLSQANAMTTEGVTTWLGTGT